MSEARAKTPVPEIQVEDTEAPGEGHRALSGLNTASLYVNRQPSEEILSPGSEDGGVSLFTPSSVTGEEQFKSNFERLPSEIIEQILYAADPPTFASLTLLNSKWRRISQSCQLYAYQLSRCPSASSSQTDLLRLIAKGDLNRLRQLFDREIWRNIFDVIMKPKKTTVKIISNVTSSSSASPFGDSFRFVFSPGGEIALALSSSRVYVIGLALAEVSVLREFKIKRKPLAATIKDDGTLMALLINDHQVNLYSLATSPVKLTQSVQLTDSAKTIALTPDATVLAVAYADAIELISVAPGASENQRRAVKCDQVDSLAFSIDGTLLMGTSLHSKTANTVVLSAPYYSDMVMDLPPTERISYMWTTQIIFPNSSRDCTHSLLLPHSFDEGDWAITHDRVFETFRAVRVDDLRNGTTYFINADGDKQHIPTTLPSATKKGEMVVAGFAGNEIWLYGVPQHLDLAPKDGSLRANTDHSGRSTPVPGSSVSGGVSVGRNSQDDISRPPQWQVLCDKGRNRFVSGRLLEKVQGLYAVKWLDGDDGPYRHRLVAAAPGGVSAPSQSDDLDPDIATADGGRLILFDFGITSGDGKEGTITIEVGDGEPELLIEEPKDLEAEVALVRRRTVAQKKRQAANYGPASVPQVPAIPLPVASGSSSSQGPGMPLQPPVEEILSRLPPTATSEAARRFKATLNAAENEDDPSIEEVQAALDGPYSHTSPRARTTLHRAATIAAQNRQHIPAPLPPISAPGAPPPRLVFRPRIPHEEDADHWVPPPPPYTARPDTTLPLPPHLLATLQPVPGMPRLDTNLVPPSGGVPLVSPQRGNNSIEEITQSAFSRARNTVHRAGTSLGLVRPTSSQRHVSNPENGPSPLAESANNSPQSNIPLFGRTPPRPMVAPPRGVMGGSFSASGSPVQPDPSLTLYRTVSQPTWPLPGPPQPFHTDSASSSPVNNFDMPPVLESGNLMATYSGPSQPSPLGITARSSASKRSNRSNLSNRSNRSTRSNRSSRSRREFERSGVSRRASRRKDRPRQKGSSSGGRNMFGLPVNKDNVRRARSTRQRSALSHENYANTGGEGNNLAAGGGHQLQDWADTGEYAGQGGMFGSSSSQPPGERKDKEKEKDGDDQKCVVM